MDETLTGQKPYGDTTSIVQISNQQLYAPLPPVHEARPGLPVTLREVLTT